MALDLRHLGATHDVRAVGVGTGQVSAGELLVEGHFAVGELGG